MSSPAKRLTFDFFPALCALAALPRASEHDRTKSALETYFVDHQIEYKLNSMLNEMVIARPQQPFGWLASRLRREEAGGAPAVGTVPLLSAAVAAQVIGADVQKTWGYAMCMSGAAPATGGSTGGIKASAGTGINLSIEPLGAGVLLAIRSC